MSNLKISKNVPLAPLTTFKIGGPAAYFTEVSGLNGVKAAVEFAGFKKLPIFVLGGGSNVLVDDGGFDGLVIKLLDEGVTVEKENERYVFLKVEAAEKWDKLVKKTVEMNLQGIECMSGISGTVGAAPVGNIGAYGQELSDVLESVLVFDIKKREVKKLSKKKCKFAYRSSLFKKGAGRKYIVLKIILKLSKNKTPDIKYESVRDYFRKKKIENPSLAEVRRAVVGIRKQKFEDPAKIPNAGSYFTNPIVERGVIEKIKCSYPEAPFIAVNGKVKLFAGWLLQRAGWKGKKFKQVGISSRHALVLVNPKGKGTAKQMKQLEKKIIVDIKRKFGVKIFPEVEFVPLRRKSLKRA